MDNWRKNFIRQIAKKCEENEVTVSKDLISFLLTLSELNPTCRIDENDAVGSENAARHVTEKLLDQTKPSLVTLKIQLYFAKHYANRDETIKKHRLRLHKKTGPLVAEICVTRNLENDRDAEKLYQKILVVVTLLSGLGNPMIPQVLREVAVALQSVFQPSELTNFVTLPKKDKEEQIVELTRIVAGIRIFNRDCQRGGEGIDDLPGILQDSVGKSREAVLDLLKDLMKTVYRLTAAVERIIDTKLADENETTDGARASVKGESPKHEETTMNDDFYWAIELLTACRQQEIYVRKLLADTELCETDVNSLMEKLQARLLKLHDSVRYRTAVPTLRVYPQFIDLADTWMKLQDQVIVLSRVNNLLWQLRLLCTKNVDVHDETRVDDILGDRDEILTDEERLERSMGQLITDGGECTIYYPNSTKDFQRVNLQFLGFCAWSFAAGEGSLIPGNPNIGILRHRGKYFAFGSAEAARKFCQDPNRFTRKAMELVRQRYEYVHLFQLYDDVEATRDGDETSEEDSCLKIHRDQGMQTDLHVLPSRRDEDYSHSLWEHRERALRLARIAECATRSTQTKNSHFRSGAHCQAALPIDRGVQTRKESQANTMKLKTFIFGLRGRRDANQHVLSLVDDEFARL